MNGLYSLKPWYADRLRPVRHLLVARAVSPHLISAAGVLAGAAAGLTLAVLRPGPVAGTAVFVLLALRLALANLDGAVARETGTDSRFGSVVNEIGDRLAELFALAGCVVLAPAALVAVAALAASTPSWVSLAGAAAGGTRLTGGPMGKTERCLVLAIIAAVGWATPLLVVLAVGSLLTVLLRLWRLREVLPC
ncbi:CDP-alcohol phosphatidyltransferase family protein [Actinoplanes sp. NPDC051851]|uniref:CDP-alcohol phosphatidyltransferase family protein n=1 Tax=Actinoplanes sp. NPDC051851 TaxID=3154753 RepID=UPI00342208F7